MYKVETSQILVDRHKEFVGICNQVENMLEQDFADAPNTTAIYNQYNIFSYTATSSLFYELYQDLNKTIRDYVGDDRKIWIQAWLNILSYEDLGKVLGPHHHNWDIHGYISIDPKDTTTAFTKFAIKNEIGNIYIGPGGNEYEYQVVNDSNWEGKRITIGYDCTFTADIQTNNRLYPLL